MLRTKKSICFVQVWQYINVISPDAESNNLPDEQKTINLNHADFVRHRRCIGSC